MTCVYCDPSAYGFGYLIYKGVSEEVDRVGLIGIFTGGFRAAAGGTAAALIFGYLAAMISKSKSKG